jgi:hypothetical protein
VSTWERKGITAGGCIDFTDDELGDACLCRRGENYVVPYKKKVARFVDHGLSIDQTKDKIYFLRVHRAQRTTRQPAAHAMAFSVVLRLGVVEGLKFYLDNLSRSKSLILILYNFNNFI